MVEIGPKIRERSTHTDIAMGARISKYDTMINDYTNPILFDLNVL